MADFKKILSLLSLVFLIQGCQSTEPEPEQASNEPRYNVEEPIELKVNKIDIISEFTPTFRRPNVEHLFPISIEKTAKIWAKDRLKAIEPESTKTARFVIKDASVVETFEKADKLFYKDRVKYRATLNVAVKISDDQKMSSAETEIEAWRELIIPADTGVAEKEKFWNGMVTKLFDEFNNRMTQNIHQYLNMYVKNNDHIQEY